MSARDRRRMWMSVASGVAAVGLFGSGAATGQQQPATARQQKAAPAPPPRTTPGEGEDTAPVGKIVRVPTNPGDPVAVINGETITRAQLAEEAFVREGEKVLDAMISRKLIDQAMKARKITVTAQEIDEEVDKYANNIAGVTREQWLANLAKERKISPIQYKNDIIYPGLALKKLAIDRVQVSEKDMKDAFEAHFGDKLRVRLIMTMRERDAVEIWKEVKKNPGGFAHLATNDQRSVDPATKVHGGLLENALTRHAYPREVSDRAFQQLVDGDPGDKDPSHKPKDGDITGPIQVTNETWVILKREGLIPKVEYDPKDPKVRQTMHTMIFDAKLKEEMSEVFDELIKSSQVDNKLTGQVKTAEDGNRLDKDVKLMRDPNAEIQKKETATAGAIRPKTVPVGVSESDRATADSIKKTVSGNGTTRKK